MKRIEILKNSLEKKEKDFNFRLKTHMLDVKSANGQPLNDKINGSSTLNRWDKQNNTLRNIEQSIEKTKRAIEAETLKIAHVESVKLPSEIQKLIDDGILTQWRKHPTYFFVKGVQKARIILLKNNTIAYKYIAEIPSQEQYTIFRDVYNNLSKTLNTLNKMDY